MIPEVEAQCARIILAYVEGLRFEKDKVVRGAVAAVGVLEKEPEIPLGWNDRLHRWE